MIEYAIMIVMEFFATSLGGVCVIERRKRQKRKAIQQKGIER
jgi:hypothetical protein